MPRKRIDIPADIDYLSILDAEGNLDKELEPDIPDADLVKLYKAMVLAREFDERMLKLQRQGRIGTFAPVKGQEAAQLGSAYPLREDDWVVPSFREATVSIWRGADLKDILLYVAGWEEGVNMPEDSTEMPISIPVASQVVYGMGLAWASKIKGEDKVSITYFGDGATSEGDFHEGLNFAGVYNTPTVFFCQNNQWAISVPRAIQTASETIAQKAIAYNIKGIQVDGNDILAVISAVREAVDRARNGEGPTLIEALTYRMSVHTTADDPTRYREDEEVAEWERRDPIKRFRIYLKEKGLMTDDDHEAWTEEALEQIRDAVDRFEARPEPDPMGMFEHIYAEEPPYLTRQRRQLEYYLGRSDEGGGF